MVVSPSSSSSGSVTATQTTSSPKPHLFGQEGRAATIGSFPNVLDCTQYSTSGFWTSRKLDLLPSGCRGETDGRFTPLSKKRRLLFSPSEQSSSRETLSAFVSFGRPHPGVFPTTDDLRNATFPGPGGLALTIGGWCGMPLPSFSNACKARRVEANECDDGAAKLAVASALIGYATRQGSNRRQSSS
jgi:hypothetical protein